MKGVSCIFEGGKWAKGRCLYRVSLAIQFSTAFRLRWLRQKRCTMRSFLALNASPLDRYPGPSPVDLIVINQVHLLLSPSALGSSPHRAWVSRACQSCGRAPSERSHRFALMSFLFVDLQLRHSVPAVLRGLFADAAVRATPVIRLHVVLIETVFLIGGGAKSRKPALSSMSHAASSTLHIHYTGVWSRSPEVSCQGNVKTGKPWLDAYICLDT